MKELTVMLMVCLTIVVCVFLMATCEERRYETNLRHSLKSASFLERSRVHGPLDLEKP